jgi:hypothetical protein
MRDEGAKRGLKAVFSEVRAENERMTKFVKFVRQCRQRKTAFCLLSIYYRATAKICYKFMINLFIIKMHKMSVNGAFKNGL